MEVSSKQLMSVVEPWSSCPALIAGLALAVHQGRQGRRLPWTRCAPTPPEPLGKLYPLQLPCPAEKDRTCMSAEHLIDHTTMEQSHG